jgi:hypothetical protein
MPLKLTVGVCRSTWGTWGTLPGTVYGRKPFPDHGLSGLGGAPVADGGGPASWTMKVES